MSGFLSGFKIAPKPLKGVQTFSAKTTIHTKLALREVLTAITSARGLSSWLGETGEFFAHVGIKFQTNVNGEVSNSVITGLDLPKRVVFIVESIGEFDFVISTSAEKVSIDLTVQRAMVPAESKSWNSSLLPIFQKLETVLINV